MSSIVFFIGILLAVAVLEHTRILRGSGRLAQQDRRSPGFIVTIIGLVSAIVEDVPLVALHWHVQSGPIPDGQVPLELMAYCAGTGGSILIIGSAAGSPPGLRKSISSGM